MILLSYPLDEKTPIFGNGNGFKTEIQRKIADGDSCNALNVFLSNHAGTHIDCPSHFDSEGKTLTDYGPEFWFSNKIQILSCNLADGELCTVEHLRQSFQNSLVKYPEAEIVLLKTGWWQKRYETRSRHYNYHHLQFFFGFLF